MTPQNIEITKGLMPGVYAAIAKLPDRNDNKVYKAALSIGWNPVYDNAEKTVEVFIIDEFHSDFYGELLQIELTAFLRAEAFYEDFTQLILAISCDIQVV